MKKTFSAQGYDQFILGSFTYIIPFLLFGGFVLCLGDICKYFDKFWIFIFSGTFILISIIFILLINKAFSNFFSSEYKYLTLDTDNKTLIITDDKTKHIELPFADIKKIEKDENYSMSSFWWISWIFMFFRAFHDVNLCKIKITDNADRTYQITLSESQNFFDIIAENIDI